MWKVDENPEVLLQILKAPEKIQKKYSIWKSLAKIEGPFLKARGWKIEKLSGPLKNFYSARLDKKWRIIFEIEGEIKIIAVLSITPHLYDKVRRKL
jgi:mRNA-degrading endonuclease RelE of RelBE toxin-antitoxin system